MIERTKAAKASNNKLTIEPIEIDRPTESMNKSSTNVNRTLNGGTDSLWTKEDESATMIAAVAQVDIAATISTRSIRVKRNGK